MNGPGKPISGTFLSSAALRRESLFRVIVLQYRSHTSRSYRAKLARLAFVFVALVIVAGCQNNAERDLIARDRRLQEDHLYAMEDYVSQYQQLVCQYRSENAALRRQLSDERTDVTTERDLQPIPQTQPSGPATRTGPRIESSPTPGSQRRPPANSNKGPDVPPLGQGAANGSNSFQPPASGARVASYEAPLAGDAAGMIGTPTNSLRSNNASARESSTEDSHDILLSGEVVANESGGGPRLMVDVEAFDQSGQVAKFDGEVSLMLVAAAGDGPMQKLARWDFGADDVRAAVDGAASEPTMRFHVELPPDVQVGDAMELWVKLMPTVGNKMLSHAKVDLSRPGVFSSRTDKIWASEESVVAASYEEPAGISSNVESAPVIPSPTTPVIESNWATAEPGKPVNLPPESDAAGGGWRRSNELIPTVVASASSSSSSTKATAGESEPKLKKSPPPKVAQKPSWTPERSGKSSPPVTRPSWSATR